MTVPRSDAADGRIPVSAHADDPVVLAGIRALLHQHTELELLAPEHPNVAVLVLCTDTVDDRTLAAIRRLRGRGAVRIMLVVGDMREAQLLDAIECGVVAVVRRREATADVMLRAVKAARSGAGELPADLLGGLLAQVGRARRSRGQQQDDIVAMPGFSARETDVIRLVAEGLDTQEIAAKLSYSERTVKNVLHGLMQRLNLRNRPHAVAYAARQGYLWNT